MVGTCNGMGGRRRHTKKHKRHSHRRHARGGFTAPSMSGVETTDAGKIAVWEGTGVSGSQPVVSGYNAAPSTMSGYGRKTRHRRSRKTRRHHRRRSMRGGTGGEGIGYGFGGPLTDGGVGAAQRAYVNAPTGNHTVDANGYNGGHP